MSLEQYATWREIQAQPAIWAAWGGALDVAGLRAWVAGLGVTEVWLCGAGSSAYLGEIVAAACAGRRIRAVATTDIVSRPHAYLTGRRVLVVSFGRSGNSAETIGLLEALDALAPDWPRLNITCNGGSALALRASPAPQRVVVLPAATHDAGFAMTSSFTTMLLTALAIFGDAMDVPARFSSLSAMLAQALPGMLAHAQGVAVPGRAVFLGAGPFAFAAREAALKVMELSGGQVAALWDTSLGFRHGPKSFMMPGTVVHLFLSPDPHARAYERDLLAELRAQFPQARVVGVGEDLPLALPDGGWGAALAVVVAQVLAVVWSQALGLAVDDPFAGKGTLSRVVSGVRLYPVVP